MRSTWKSHSDFIADLVNFVVWPGNHPRNFYDEIDARAKSLLEGPDAVDAVHDLAYLNVAEDISWPASRLATIVTVAAEGDKTISEAISRSYQEFLEPWKKLYVEFIEARGMQLRPGIALDDIANLLAALLDGLGLRMIADPSDKLVDHDRRRTLLGTAVLAVIYSFLEPAREATGLTLEQAVHEMIYGQIDPRETTDPLDSK